MEVVDTVNKEDEMTSITKKLYQARQELNAAVEKQEAIKAGIDQKYPLSEEINPLTKKMRAILLGALPNHRTSKAIEEAARKVEGLVQRQENFNTAKVELEAKLLPVFEKKKVDIQKQDSQFEAWMDAAFTHILPPAPNDVNTAQTTTSDAYEEVIDTTTAQEQATPSNTGQEGASTAKEPVVPVDAVIVAEVVVETSRNQEPTIPTADATTPAVPEATTDQNSTVPVPTNDAKINVAVKPSTPQSSWGDTFLNVAAKTAQIGLKIAVGLPIVGLFAYGGLELSCRGAQTLTPVCDLTEPLRENVNDHLTDFVTNVAYTAFGESPFTEYFLGSPTPHNLDVDETLQSLEQSVQQLTYDQFNEVLSDISMVQNEVDQANSEGKKLSLSVKPEYNKHLQEAEKALGVNLKKLTSKDLNKLYHDLARKIHPDKCTSEICKKEFLLLGAYKGLLIEELAKRAQ